MCEFCGINGGACGVCDSGLAVGVMELVPGWDVAGEWHGPDVLPFAVPVLAVAEEREAVLPVWEVRGDVEYALRQLRQFRDVGRALDALERVHNRLVEACVAVGDC